MLVKGSVEYRVEVRSYQRWLKKPLKTFYGDVKKREGLIVRLEDKDGNVGYGEVAPYEAFGSESIEDAKAFFYRLGEKISDGYIDQMDTDLVCCRYGLACARYFLKGGMIESEAEVENVGLISGDSDILTEVETLVKSGYRTLKFKMGVRTLDEEKELFKEIYKTVYPEVSLRLDCNESLNKEEAESLLSFLEDYEVEFIEQPLPVGQEKEMALLGDRFITPIALDESVAGIERMQEVVKAGWKEYLIVKPSLLGSIEDFLHWREYCACPLVYSSVFETRLGVSIALRLAIGDWRNQLAVGFGTIDYFDDDMNFPKGGAHVSLKGLRVEDFDALWDKCLKEE